MSKETLGFMAFLLIPAAFAYGTDFLKWVLTQLFAKPQPVVEAPAAAPRPEYSRRRESAPAAVTPVGSVAPMAAPAVANFVQTASPERRPNQELTEAELQYQLFEAAKQRRETSEPVVVVPPEDYVAPILSPAELRDFDYADFRTHEIHS